MNLNPNILLSLSSVLLLLLGASCSKLQIPDHHKPFKKFYLQGVKEAKADQKKGIKKIPAIECYETDDYLTLGQLIVNLEEEYGINYDVVSPSPIPGIVAYVDGYNSIAYPPLKQLLGENWYQREFKKAEKQRLGDF